MGGDKGERGEITGPEEVCVCKHLFFPCCALDHAVIVETPSSQNNKGDESGGKKTRYRQKNSHNTWAVDTESTLVLVELRVQILGERQARPMYVRMALTLTHSLTPELPEAES